MSDSKHTPGPWTAERVLIKTSAYNEVGYVCHGSTVVAQTWTPGNGAPHHAQVEETLANARLIAAAPEMLEALKYVSTQCDMLEMNDAPWMKDVLAAIAKAEGKQKGAD